MKERRRKVKKAKNDYENDEERERMRMNEKMQTCIYEESDRMTEGGEALREERRKERKGQGDDC